MCPHFDHALVSVRLMATRRSLLGMIPCIAAYHADFVASGTSLACKFSYIRFQLIPGNFRTIRNSLGVLPLLASLSRTLYTRRSNFFRVSSVA